MQHALRVCAAMSSVAIGADTTWAQATFRVIPGPAPCLAWGLSGDGGTLVGTGNFSPSDIGSWRWTQAGGTERVPLDNSSVRAASYDGSVVALMRYGAMYRWMNGGFDPVAMNGLTPYQVAGMSSNGNMIVGQARARGGLVHAFRWASETGAEDLGALPGRPVSEALGVAGAGDVVVGSSWDDSPSVSSIRAFRWTPAGGMQDLGVLPGKTQSEGSAVSADGRIAVGMSYVPYAFDGLPFIWTEQEGMRALAPVAELPCWALAVSADGAVVAGRSRQEMFVWTAQTGIQDLRQTLVSGGAIVPAAFSLQTLQLMISHDGRTLAGQGASGGFVLSWIARLPTGFGCYPNCDGSLSPPVLNAADFLCFLQKFGAGDPYANCNQSTTPPVLNVADFTCFLQKFAAGCP